MSTIASYHSEVLPIAFTVTITGHEGFLAESLWYSQVMTSGSQFFSWSLSSFIFWHSSLISIYLVVNGYKHAFQSFETL